MRAPRLALGVLGTLVLALMGTAISGCSGDGGDFVLSSPASTWATGAVS